MKILLVTWYFPPVNTIGAVRTGKLARFLIERGHEIGVVAGKDWNLPETMPLDFLLKRVAYARSRDVNALPRKLASWVRRNRGVPASVGAATATAGSSNGILRRASDLYMNLTNIPDHQIGWYPDIVRQGGKLTHDWKPDIVFGSAPLFTAFLACRTFSKRLGVPWVGELRDRWADDTYAEWPRWRHALEQRIERLVLGSAAGIVAVTEPWSEFYRAKYGVPVETVYNGYDPRDFPFDPHAKPHSDSPQVRIVYTGGIYPGRRDPTPLFNALRLLGPDGDKFRVHFYGTDPNAVWPLADRAAVRHLVEVHKPVPFRESIRLQWDSDVLLLLQWNSPKEEGVCPGKLFEYLASLRPILGIGYEQGVPAGFIRERGAGVFANEPATIAEHLRRWAAEKSRHGYMPRLPVSVREGLERDRQFEKLERFLAGFVRR
jgi:glycosyltransferase involved in cell wall biosynthesis